MRVLSGIYGLNPSLWILPPIIRLYYVLLIIPQLFILNIYLFINVQEARAPYASKEKLFRTSLNCITKNNFEIT